MTPEELARRRERAETGDWIISQTEEGYRIHSPGSQGTPYRVTGLPDRPVCSCPDYEHHAQDPDWRCKHILAVQKHLAGSPEAGRTAEPETPVEGSRVLIKRSVSPDGKIDALSVELSAPAGGQDPREVESRAGKMLALGDRIVEQFLERNGGPERTGRSGGRQRRPPNRERPRPRNEAVPAELVTVRGEDGKWGRRLYVTVRTEDGYLRLYGSENQLAEYLADAGYPELTDRIEEDFSLRVPCRIVTETNEDGYVEITRVLPPAHGRDRRGAA